MRPLEIAARVKALRLKKAELARLSGLNETHVGQVLNGRRPAVSQMTVEKISRAVEALEHAELQRLVELYPQIAMEAATIALCSERSLPVRAA